MEEPVQIENRGDFGQWAIEVAKQIIMEQGFELAKAAQEGTDDDVRMAGNALGQAITDVLLEVYDALLDDPSEGEA